jgi:cellulose biosynthesis protein BcsQ
MPHTGRSAAVITVLNLKGGVGKTKTTWILASVAQEHGQRILLINSAKHF